MRSGWMSCLVGALACASTGYAAAADLNPLDEFASANGVLDVTMIVGQRTVNIGGASVATNVYTICESKDYDTTVPGDCATQPANPYGGTALRVQPKDHLKIHLINRMSGEENGMPLGPDSLMTNLHTHGLLVRARGIDEIDVIGDENTSGKYEQGSIGDFIFVAIQPEATPAMQGHAAHAAMGASDLRFDIEIPDRHPPGIFWFHPHYHGLAKRQVSSGMAGMIVVDGPDYMCLHVGTKANGEPECQDDPNDSTKLPVSMRDDIAVRTILLKDAQITTFDETAKTGVMFDDQDPGFCGKAAGGTNGYCSGRDLGPDGPDFTGGRWIFSLNGVQHPQWNAAAATGNDAKPGNTEIWRIQNGSANITYNLCLEAEGFPVQAKNGDEERCDGSLPFQVLSLDGVAFGTTGGSPGVVPVTDLQRRIVLMPGSRIEILVTPRDKDLCPVGKVTNDSCAQFASNLSKDFPVEIRTLAYDTGGDGWPEIALGTVTFHQAPGVTIAGLNTVAVNARFEKILAGAPPATSVFVAESVDGLCRESGAYRLGAGESRRVYFAIVSDATVDANKPEQFLLGTTIVTDAEEWYFDESGSRVTVDDSHPPLLRPFDAAETRADLCVPTDAGTETWQLVNISGEVHNFHIHQSKFNIAPCTTDGPCSAPSGGLAGPAFFATSDIDKLNLTNAVLVNESEGHFSPDKARLHDTIIVPRGTATECAARDIKIGSRGSFIRHIPVGFNRLHPVYVYDQNGACIVSRTDKDGTAGWIDVQIPFDQSYSVGKYVFHCHILEHEDRGMMAAIRVLTASQEVASGSGVK